MDTLPAVELREVCKRFGSVQANLDISLSVGKGSIHGIIGENGAGKSTAMKVLYGLYAPDSGAVLLDGNVRRWKSPREAIAAGVGMVHQHFMLGKPYSALDNIILGSEPCHAWSKALPGPLQWLDRRQARARIEKLAEQTGLAVNLDARVEQLPVGIQQRIEILKLLYRNANVLILDEPTAVLTPQEVRELFVTLRGLRDQGKTILIITHKLKEVISVTDDVTVFRAGRVSGSAVTADCTEADLARMMVGRDVTLRVAAPAESKPGEAVLELDNVSLDHAAFHRKGINHLLHDLSFSVRAGEIVGVAGVEGNGQSELLQILCHPSDYKGVLHGRLQILGSDAKGLASNDLRGVGVGIIAEDRQREGVLLDSPLDENFLLGFQDKAKFRRGHWFIYWRRLRDRALAAMQAFDVRPLILANPMAGLSGGNQQKFVIAREFQDDPKFLIAAHPTRGVDIGAIEFIHSRILDARNRGAGVLLVSSELDEVLSLSDRILVMYEGRVVAELARSEADAETVGIYMGGGKKREE